MQTSLCSIGNNKQYGDKGFCKTYGLNFATKALNLLLRKRKYHLVKGLVIYFSRKHHPYLKYIMPAAFLRDGSFDFVKYKA